MNINLFVFGLTGWALFLWRIFEEVEAGIVDSFTAGFVIGFLVVFLITLSEGKNHGGRHDERVRQ